MKTPDLTLEAVRTVLHNDVCEVSVCTDRAGHGGAFYTDVAVLQPELRRDLARRLSDDSLFSANDDFLGSFTLRDGFHLVFRYHRENPLRPGEDCAFAERKRLAVSFLAACAQACPADGIGELVLDARNINAGETGEVYFNYFLDFSRLRPADDLDFLRTAGMRVYDILSSGYRARFDGDTKRYPEELALFCRKAQARGFSSLSQLLAFVGDLPDEPVERYTGARLLLLRARRLWGWARAHAAEALLVLLAAFTAVYAAVQIAERVRAGQARQEEDVYAGIGQIGEVSLGDEDI